MFDHASKEALICRKQGIAFTSVSGWWCRMVRLLGS